MLSGIRRKMFPITLSKGLEIVVGLSNPGSKTGEWYSYSVGNFIDYYGDIPVTAVSRDMVLAWSKSLDDEQRKNDGKRYSEHTKNSYRRAVRAYFNKLVKTGHIDPPGPTQGLKIPDPPKGEPRHLSAEDVEKIRQQARNSPRDHALVEMLYATGCRISELGTMKVSNLQIQKSSSKKDLSDEEAAVLELAAEMNLEHMLKDDLLDQLKGKILVIGKGQNGKKKIRWCYFGDESARALLSYLELRPHDAPDEIFLNAVKGTPLTRFGFHHILKKIFRRAGVEASAHDLRHTFAYRLMRNGADPKMVQTFLGHSDLHTTIGIYYNLTDSEMWDAYEEFG